MRALLLGYYGARNLGDDIYCYFASSSDRLTAITHKCQGVYDPVTSPVNLPVDTMRDGSPQAGIRVTLGKNPV
ncbi:MAG: hypothetical protein KatS3mg023_1215 [Armatimonadota bacterium]|nr:MAG: hypothetical protein KatS3mg023_1215 [Armatimonadota bacterium]